MLIIKGADFSTNGTSIVDPAAEKLNAIKSAIEEEYHEHLRFGSGKTNAKPPKESGDTRNAFGAFDAAARDLSPFIVTPKTGCKIVPVQSDGNTARFSFTWKTGAVTFDNFSTYPNVGANLAYSNDDTIPTGTSVWEFIDVALAE